MLRRYVWIILLVAAGCGGSSRSRASYVRNPFHHCVENSDTELKKNTLVVEANGEVGTMYGWRSWNCDGGIYVIIHNNEEQP